ncbi:MAG: HD domain-containing protein [Deltaproteobacteria bacterium]|nr:HD domain-containing protein [Deltaproteobacteria bacterium]
MIDRHQYLPKDKQIKRDYRAGRLAAELNGLVDVRQILSKVLEGARSLCSAEAGTVYLLSEGRLTFVCSQNSYLERVVTEFDGLPFEGQHLLLNRLTLAGFVACERKILVVNDTDNIDPDSPYQHLKSIDLGNNYICKAIMTLPLITVGDDLLGVLQIINPLDDFGQVTEFDEFDERVLEFFANFSAMALEKAVLLRDSVLTNIKLVMNYDHTETLAHAQRVAALSTEIYANWSSRFKIATAERQKILNLLPLAAMLHDLGKSFVPTGILTKPGRLDLRERSIMEKHVQAGAKLFQNGGTPLDRLAYSIILDHHERWDGRGYPGYEENQEESLGRRAGKKGEDISIFGRILAAADVYDALSSCKTYKEAFDESLAVQIMEQESGHHFDPSVIESFMAIRPILGKIRDRFPERVGL